MNHSTHIGNIYDLYNKHILETWDNCLTYTVKSYDMQPTYVENIMLLNSLYVRKIRSNIQHMSKKIMTFIGRSLI